MCTDTPASDGRLTNALIGAVVTVVLPFVPFSPLLGGAVAGYLQERDGFRVGAPSGAIAAVPSWCSQRWGCSRSAGSRSRPPVTSSARRSPSS
jgi:hypothetical protein